MKDAMLEALMDEAISELAENEVEWIDTANEEGIPVPEIMTAISG